MRLGHYDEEHGQMTFQGREMGGDAPRTHDAETNENRAAATDKRLMRGQPRFEDSCLSPSDNNPSPLVGGLAVPAGVCSCSGVLYPLSVTRFVVSFILSPFPVFFQYMCMLSCRCTQSEECRAPVWFDTFYDSPSTPPAEISPKLSRRK